MVVLKQEIDFESYEKLLNASLWLFSFASSNDKCMLLQALADKHLEWKNDPSRLVSVISYPTGLCTIRCSPGELSEVALVFRCSLNLFRHVYVAEQAGAVRKHILLDDVEPESEEDQIELMQDSAAPFDKKDSLGGTLDELKKPSSIRSVISWAVLRGIRVGAIQH